MGDLEQGTKTMLKPEESPQWREGANFGEKGSGDLVGEEASAGPIFQR